MLYHDADEKAKKRNPNGYAYVRPREMFLETVDHNGMQMPRFQRLAKKPLSLFPKSKKFEMFATPRLIDTPSCTNEGASLV